MTEEVNQIRSQSQNLAMTQNLSQLTLDTNSYPKIVRSSSVRSWNTPIDKRSAIVYDELNKNDEIRALFDTVSRMTDIGWVPKNSQSKFSTKFYGKEYYRR